MSSYFNYIDTVALDKKLETGEYPFTEKLFSETNLTSLKVSLNQNQIIETILTIGILSDFYVLLKLYTKEEITTAVKNSLILDKKTANFCSYYFNIPKEEIYASPDLDYSGYKDSFWFTFNLLKKEQERMVRK